MPARLKAVQAMFRTGVGMAAGLLAAGAPAPGAAPAPDYTGSVSCRECHEQFYTLWAPSHHGLAMQIYTPSFAASNLTAQTDDMAIGAYRYRAAIGPAEGWVTETGPAGAQRLRIDYVMGGKNVYYFLTTLERGRLQTLPTAYDVHRRGWFDTAASGVRHFPDLTPDAPIHWTEPPYTFNTACYDCHVSQLSPNYDIEKDSYRTVWKEPGINCETCHGPGAEHIRVCRAAPTNQPPKDLKIILTKPMTPEQRNDMCSTCHAKMRPITPSFTPGERFFDHFDLVTLEDRDFYPDGRDLGENYTFTTWRMSPCALSGRLDCMHCHTSSGRYRFKDEAKANHACLPCHEERVKTAASHTHHRPEVAGNRCVSCHMPKTEFARMWRSDHSMRPPTPAATLAYQSPSACALCHTNRDARWADAKVREWHKEDYQAPVLARAALVDAARRQDWSKQAALTDYLRRPDREEIAANALVRLMRGNPSAAATAALAAALRDPSPLIRSSAADALTGRFGPDTLPALLAATRDEYRLVRVRAASALATYPVENLSPVDRASLDRAVAEFETAMRARPDDAISHYNLANFLMDRRDLKQALSEFNLALRLQPDNVLVLVNAAIAHSRVGDTGRAEGHLRRALHLDPTNAPASFNYGLLMAELGKPAEAEKALRSALKADPRMAQAAYNLGVLVAGDRLDEAIHWCRQASDLQPDEPRYGYTYAFFLRQKGDMDGAIRALRRMVDAQHANADVYGLLGQTLGERRDLRGALEVYRRAAGDARLSGQERAQFREMTATLEQHLSTGAR